MQHIQVSEGLYQDASRRATEHGYASVDEYVSTLLRIDLGEGDAEKLDHLFTPERLAHIDKAVAEIEAGKSVTMEEVREHFRRRRDA